MLLRKPLQVLYHGTSSSNAARIQQQGLIPVNYEHVYLTADVQVAYDYAMNKTSGTDNLPVICIVDSIRMQEDGYEFYHNVVTAEWTVCCVPEKYLLQVIVENASELKHLVCY